MWVLVLYNMNTGMLNYMCNFFVFVPQARNAEKAM